MVVLGGGEIERVMRPLIGASGRALIGRGWCHISGLALAASRWNFVAAGRREFDSGARSANGPNFSF